MRRLLKFLALAFVFVAVLAVAGTAVGLYVLHEYGRGLPDYRQLADYEPPIVTRIHAGDGRLMAEFASEKRVFVPVEVIPRRLIQAFLAAEDKNFFRHPGIDPLSVVRAVFTNVERYWSGRRPVGASTITQQVAKNFLLTNELSIKRKIKEALLALRIERAFTKEQILELYLNEIYLGIGSYGVAAAALNYFDKSLDALTTAEAAFLAGLPKAPSNYHPVHNPEAARARRDWVIGRMLDIGVIDAEEAAAAVAEPLTIRQRGRTEVVDAAYFTEEVRRELVERYGERALYEGGLSVRTTLDPRLQVIAEEALRDGLAAYDRRHGWRGPAGRMEVAPGWTGSLAERERAEGVVGWRLALVLNVDVTGARIGLADASEGRLPLEAMTWARAAFADGGLGPEISHPEQVLAVGDLVWVEAIAQDDGGEGGDTTPSEPHDASSDQPQYALRQVPEIEGAVVALNPHTGRVLAMSGGFSYQRSEYNRAVQALRQPGSALKPFVYLAALENGFTPSSIILDAPLVVDQGPNQGKWKPENYSNQFYGPSTLRLGVEKSRNLMTVRLAQATGMENVVEVARRFDIARGMGLNLASALGAGEVDLLRLSAAYAMLVNGGKRIQPALIERIQDNHGRTVARRDARPCAGCQARQWESQPVPLLPDLREQVVDPAHAYQVVSILQGVVERGTGRAARTIGKPIAGKTGTSNESRDAWFIGFTPDLVIGVYVGFDQPKSLGRRETGATAALPVFTEIMAAAVADEPATPFRVPPGVRLVRVDVDTGMLPDQATRETILEAFIPGTEPTRNDVRPATVTQGGGGNGTPLVRPPPQTGGLY